MLISRGKKIYEPPRYQSCSEAASQLIQIIKKRNENGQDPLLTEDSKVVGLARVGWHDQKVCLILLARI